MEEEPLLKSITIQRVVRDDIDAKVLSDLIKDTMEELIESGHGIYGLTKSDKDGDLIEINVLYEILKRKVLFEKSQKNPLYSAEEMERQMRNYIFKKDYEKSRTKSGMLGGLF